LLTGRPAGGLRENHTHSSSEVQTKKKFHGGFKHYYMKAYGRVGVKLHTALLSWNAPKLVRIQGGWERHLILRHIKLW
jgi:hypothetical protein